MAEWYKMAPNIWDNATAGLSLEEEAALLRIVNAIQKNDVPVPHNDRVLAGMFRCSTRKARALLAALVEAGKVYLEDGFIWSERARDEVGSRAVRAKLNAENGAKGGRTSGEARRVARERAAKPLEDNETGQAAGSTKNRIEESREDIPPFIPPEGGGDAKPSKPKRAASPDRFEEFWEAYGHKVGKGAAIKAWKAAIKRADPETIIAGAARYAQARGGDKQFWKHPQGWLSADRWEDDQSALKANGASKRRNAFGVARSMG